MELILATLASILTTGAPLFLAALGETIAERAGIVNLSLDGTILLTAMIAAATAAATNNPYIGIAAGAIAGAISATVLAITTLWLGCSQFAVGFALTLLYRNLAYFLSQYWNQKPWPQLTIAFEFLRNIPICGLIISKLNISILLSLALLIVALWWSRYTKNGKILRGVGENPKAAYSRGVNVHKIKYLALSICGTLTGLAGAIFSLLVKPNWGGAEGSGWIALAIVIFGGWKPLQVAIGAYLFSTIQLLSIYLQKILPIIPIQLLLTPFPVMILVIIIMNFTEIRSFKAIVQRHPLLKACLNAVQVHPPAAIGTHFNPKDIF